MHKKKGVNRVRPSRHSRISPIGVDVMGTIADGSQRDFLRLENFDVDIPPDSVVLTRTQELVTQDASNSYLPFVGQTRLREVAARHVSVIAGVDYSGKRNCVISPMEERFVAWSRSIMFGFNRAAFTGY